MNDEQLILTNNKTVNKFIRPFIVRVDYDFYISGPIQSPENYIEEFDLIRNAQEDDIVMMHINTPGGNLDTAIQFMRVMNESAATIVSSIEGYCMSAGTILFLKADEFMVSPHSMIQCHNYSGGMIGKGHEIFDQAIFEKDWSVKLLNDVYDQFLTQTEIDSIILGKDLWLTSDETIKRCQKLQEYRAELYKMQQEDIEAKED